MGWTTLSGITSLEGVPTTRTKGFGRGPVPKGIKSGDRDGEVHVSHVPMCGSTGGGGMCVTSLVYKL